MLGQAKALHDAGAEVDLIVGFRNEHLIILKEEETDGEVYLTQIENEEEINAVYDLFMEQILEDGEG